MALLLAVLSVAAVIGSLNDDDDVDDYEAHVLSFLFLFYSFCLPSSFM
jgi:hypothetical protein